MPISDEVRRLGAKWSTGSGWNKRLDWIEITGLRGWNGQRFSFQFPIMAVIGENGVGKSTVLQCAAAVYRQPSGSLKKSRFASDFFPDTAWEQIKGASIKFCVREGNQEIKDIIRKPGERWRGNPERPERAVEYIDLSRIQPVPARVGYARLAKAEHSEVSAASFDELRLSRLSQVMGRQYELAKMSITDADARRSVPVLGHQGAQYSGFHQGAGETTVAELLQVDLPRGGIILIDEIETSLHPRSQRRLIRDLATMCRDRELQVILTTHSPYVLDELPFVARACIMATSEGRSVVYGVSPEFAMTKMDDVPQHECDVYVEDKRAEAMLAEIVVAHDHSLLQRCLITPYGAASVGQALGQMVDKERFRRPTCVFLDGDQGPAPGCSHLPGDDAPERVVFGDLRAKGWGAVALRAGRPHPDLVDACEQAMTLRDHHDWVRQAATPLYIGGDTLWQALCGEWAKTCLGPQAAEAVLLPIHRALEEHTPEAIVTHPQPRATTEHESSAILSARAKEQAHRGPPKGRPAASSPTGFGPLFAQPPADAASREIEPGRSHP